jgi:hypothetical protein
MTLEVGGKMGTAGISPLRLCSNNLQSASGTQLMPKPRIRLAYLAQRKQVLVAQVQHTQQSTPSKANPLNFGSKSTWPIRWSPQNLLILT